MAKVTPVTIVNVGCRSTNYWVVGVGRSRLLVDIGWPGTLGTMKAHLKKMGVPPETYAFDNPVALASWKLLRAHGATRVYPAHGPIRRID